MSHVLDVLEECLTTSTFYSDTNVELAETFMESVRIENPEKVVIAITGDVGLIDAKTVSKILNALCRPFKHTDNFRFVTGEFEGVERIIRAHAKRNNIEVDVYPILPRNDWELYEHTARQDRDIRMIAGSHVAIVFTEGRSKECTFFYKTAIDEGRFTTRRKIKPLAREGKK